MVNGSVLVLIPCFNGEKYLRETIQSVKKQTVKPGGIVLLDDGSTDSSRKVAEEEGVVVDKWKKNMGIGMARKQGMALLSTRDYDEEYFAFISADDVWRPNFLEKSLESASPMTITYTNWYRCDPSLAPKSVFLSPEPTIVNILDWASRFNMFINFSTLLIPNQKEKLPEFDSRLRYGEDLAWTLEALLMGWEFKLIPEPLVFYREHPEQWTAKGWDSQTKAVFYPKVHDLTQKVGSMVKDTAFPRIY